MSKTKTSPRPHTDRTIVWSAPEFEYIHNTVNWYWVVGTLGFLFSLVSFFSGNWTFAFLLLLSTFMLMVLSTKRPAVVNVSLNKNHITIDDKKYSLKKFSAYRIDENRDKLLLRSEKLYHTLTVVPLPHDAPKAKITHLFEEETELEQEDELSEPVLDIIMHRLGF